MLETNVLECVLDVARVLLQDCLGRKVADDYLPLQYELFTPDLQ